MWYKAEDEAEIFAECLEKQLQPNPWDDAEYTAALSEHLERYFTPPIETRHDNPVIVSPSEVERELKRSNPKKTPGVDTIPNMALCDIYRDGPSRR